MWLRRSRSAAVGLVVAVAAVFTTASPCAAQVSVEVTPFVGLYAPTADILDGYDYVVSVLGPDVSCGGATNFCSAVMRQRMAPTVGGRLTTWLDRRFAVELALGYSESSVTGFGQVARTPGGPSITPVYASASIVAGSARILLSTPRTYATSFYVLGGWAFVAHGGAPYNDSFTSTTGWGPVLGIGTRRRVGPLLALRAEVVDYSYEPGFVDRQSTPAYPLFQRAQNDLMFSLGLSVTLVGGPPAPPEERPTPRAGSTSPWTHAGAVGTKGACSLSRAPRPRRPRASFRPAPRP